MMLLVEGFFVVYISIRFYFSVGDYEVKTHLWIIIYSTVVARPVFDIFKIASLLIK